MNLNDIVVLRPSSFGRVSEGYFNFNKLGTSDCNMFIPVYALKQNSYIFNFTDIGVKVIEYCLYRPHTVYSPYRKYDRLQSDLISCYSESRRYLFKIGVETHFIHVNRGILYDNEDILMCLAVSSEYAINNTIEEISERPNNNEFVLFVSNKFKEAKYKNVRKKLELNYISKVKELGIDIIETSKIDNWLFKNNFKKPKFKTVLEMNKHLKEELPNKVLLIR